jgi:hypothetical protein
MKLFAETMDQLDNREVVYDMMVVSHGEKGVVNRAIELVLYRDDKGNCEEAENLLIGWPKQHKLPFHLPGKEVI